MSGDKITFTMDGHPLTAQAGETIWQAAQRQGIDIPHLCHRPAPGFRSEGNCRACLVEIAGERTLAPSCRRHPHEGMKVLYEAPRALRARRTVFELLLSATGEAAAQADPQAPFWRWAETLEARPDHFAPRQPLPVPDLTHPAMAVRLEACIHCGLCVQACRDVQGNDVIGMAGRGSEAKIVFDFDDPMGKSSCVACGECLESCPTGALREAAPEARLTPDRKIESVCPYCGVGCQMTYHVLEDRIARVTGAQGPANLGRLCVKGRFGFDYIRHPHRLTQPWIRQEGMAKGGSEEIDPADPSTHFRPASWEEALDRAAQGFLSLRDRQGGSALAGFGSAKGSNEEAYLFQKLIRTGFQTHNVDHCTRLCHASSVAALFETIGSAAVTAPFRAAEQSDVIFIIGANPTLNHPVAATFFKSAARRGAKLIVADPRGQTLSRFAALSLQHRPGSDVALLNGMAHVILAEGLQNDGYIQDHTEGFETLRQHLAAFMPEQAAFLCDVPAETIRQAARLFAKARAAIIFWGMGISQHVHGTDNARALINLALLCGQVGRPGTGLHPLRGQNNVQGASDAGLIPMFLPDYQPVAEPQARAAWAQAWNVPALPENAGLTVVEITQAIHKGQIRGLYIMGENPAMSDPDLAHTRAALAKLEHLVVQDLFLTETARFADVLLPASAWPEKTGTVTNTDRRVQLGQPAVPLPGQARQDLWILCEMAKRFGLNWQYEDAQAVFEEMRKQMPSHHGISWQRLQRERAVTYPARSETLAGEEILFSQRFPTKNGRARLSAVTPLPPHEQPDEAFPFFLSTGRILEHWHTGAMTRRADLLDHLEPEAFATFAPADLTRLGVKAGGQVRIETRRGHIDLTARADPQLSSGMIAMPFCFPEAAANLLTHDALDPFGKIPEFKISAARVKVL